MHAETYLQEVAEIAKAIDPQQIESMAAALSKVEGRVYMVGLGGSLANCIHMAADLRKLCNIDAVAPDNIAELTAWANDEGLENMFTGYIRNISSRDAIFVLSVGGGTPTVSLSITNCLSFAMVADASIFGRAGPQGGHTYYSAMNRNRDHVIRIPAPEGRVTPHTEAFQMVICHLLVSHPLLQKRATKWV